MNFCLSDLVPPLRWSDAARIRGLHEPVDRDGLPDAWWRTLPMAHVLAALDPEDLAELLAELALEHWYAAAIGDILPALHVLDPEEADEPHVAIALDRAGSWTGLLALTGRELHDQPFIQARPVLTALFAAVFARLAESHGSVRERPKAEGRDLQEPIGLPPAMFPPAGPAAFPPASASFPPSIVVQQQAAAAKQAAQDKPAKRESGDLFTLIDAAFADLDDQAWAVAQNRLFTDDPSEIDQLAKLFAVPAERIEELEERLRERLADWLAGAEAEPYRRHLEAVGEALGVAAPKSRLVGAADWHKRELRSLDVPAWQFVLATLPGHRLHDGWLVAEDLAELREKTRGLLADGVTSVDRAVELVATLGVHPEVAQDWLESVPGLRVEETEEGAVVRRDEGGPKDGAAERDSAAQGSDQDERAAERGEEERRGEPEDGPAGQAGAGEAEREETPQEAAASLFTPAAPADSARAGDGAGPQAAEPEPSAEARPLPGAQPPKPLRPPYGAAPAAPAAEERRADGTPGYAPDAAAAGARPPFPDAADGPGQDKTITGGRPDGPRAENAPYGPAGADPARGEQPGTARPAGHGPAGARAGDDALAPEPLPGDPKADLPSTPSRPTRGGGAGDPGSPAAANPGAPAAVPGAHPDAPAAVPGAHRDALAAVPGGAGPQDMPVGAAVPAEAAQGSAGPGGAAQGGVQGGAGPANPGQGNAVQVNEAPRLDLPSTPSRPTARDGEAGGGVGGQLKDVSLTRRCFRQPDGRWWFRVDVTEDHLAGGPCAIPSGFAAYLGLTPGESRTVRCATGEITLSWQPRPALDVIRPLLLEAAARAGGHLFLTLTEEGTLRARHLPAASETDKTAQALRLVGYTAPGGTMDQALRVIATRVGMTGSVSRNDLLGRLRERGDRDLLSLLATPVAH